MDSSGAPGSSGGGGSAGVGAGGSFGSRGFTGGSSSGAGVGSTGAGFGAAGGGSIEPIPGSVGRMLMSAMQQQPFQRAARVRVLALKARLRHDSRIVRSILGAAPTASLRSGFDD